MFVSLCRKNCFKSLAFSTYKLSENYSCTRKTIYPSFNIRQYSSQIQNKPNNPESENVKWRTIYRLPLIRWISSLSKLKFYQFGLLAAGTPLVIALETSSQIPQHCIPTFLSLGITGLISLSIGSWYAQNLIGFIYISPNEDHLRISYVDFWGKRKDSTYNVKDILDVTSSKFNLFQNVQTNDKKYKLIYKFGEVSDNHCFSSIFGE